MKPLPRLRRTPRGTGEQPRRRWRPDALASIVALALIAGVISLTYPTAAAWVSQANQSNVVYDQSVANAAAARADIDGKIEQAREYNRLLSSGGVLGAGENVPRGAGSPGEFLTPYRDLLRAEPTGVMSRLQIPSIGVDLPVYHGTDEQTLLRGAGHLEGTSLPIGGTGTRSVLTGHRGLATAAMFTNLDRVVVGDTFAVQTLGLTLVYRVVSTEVVAPEDREELRPDPDRDLMTLVTCTPLGINSHRILVTGERVVPTPDGASTALAEPADVPGFPWWLVLSGIALSTILAWYVRSGLPPRPARTAGRDDSRSALSHRHERSQRTGPDRVSGEESRFWRGKTG